MKVFVFACVLFALLQAPPSVFGASARVSDAEATHSCITELNLDETTFKSFNSLKVYNEADTKFHDLLSCSWKKLGLQGDDGKIKFPELIDYLTDFCEKQAAKVFSAVPDRPTVEGWLENCRDLHGDTPGRTAAKVHFCLSRGIDKFRELHKKQ